MRKQRNRAYIDAANLHNAVRAMGWLLDYKRFRRWLTDKFHVEIAYLFIGKIEKLTPLYNQLRQAGFVLIFREVVYDGFGNPKGNCDADLIVKAMEDVYEADFDKSIIVSSDGDYVSLINFLLEKECLEAIVSPAPPQKCSVLLKRTGARISYISDQRSKLEKR